MKNSRLYFLLLVFILISFLSCQKNEVKKEGQLEMYKTNIVESGPWTIDTNITSVYAYPGGKLKCLLMSFDDGLTQDRRLVEIFNKYGIKGTFNINSGRFGQKVGWLKDGTNYYINKYEMTNLYIGHEVASHTINHPDLTKLDKNSLRFEVGNDQKNLEKLIGKSVRGLAYPMGYYNKKIIPWLHELGIVYARAVSDTGKYRLPSNLLAWKPTCHHKRAEFWGKSFFEDKPVEMQLFFIWGHSWELSSSDTNSCWEYIEKFCKNAGNRDDIWYATCIEAADYFKALTAVTNCSNNILYNPSTNITVWKKVGSKAVPIAPGMTIDLSSNF